MACGHDQGPCGAGWVNFSRKWICQEALRRRRETGKPGTGCRVSMSVPLQTAIKRASKFYMGDTCKARCIQFQLTTIKDTRSVTAVNQFANNLNEDIQLRAAPHLPLTAERPTLRTCTPRAVRPTQPGLLRGENVLPASLNSIKSHFFSINNLTKWRKIIPGHNELAIVTSPKLLASEILNHVNKDLNRP